MSENKKLNKKELSVLANHSIDPSDVFLFVRSDMNENQEYTRRTVILTKDALCAFTGEDGGSFFKKPLTEIISLSVKENISSARAVVKFENGESVILTYLSMTLRDEFYYLARALEGLKKGEEIPPRDEDERFCPKCGRRYPDRNRKFCPECMDKASVIKRMATFVLKYKWRIVIMMLILVMMSALAVVAPYISSGFFYDEVLTEGGDFFGRIGLVILLIFALRLFRMLMNMMSGVISSALSAKMVRDLKRTIFEAIERLSLGYFTQRSTGALMNQVYHDANTIYWFFTDGLPYFAISLVQLISVTVIMLIINPLLTLFAVLLFPIVFILIGKLFNADRRLHEKRYTRSRALSGMLSDLLTGIRIVKTFSREKTETERFGVASRNLATAEKKRSFFGSTAYPFVNVLVYIGVILVWCVGGVMIIKGYLGMTYGMLLTFVSYVGIIYDPMYMFVDMVSWGSDGLNSMNRLFEVLDATVEVKEKENPVHKEVFEGAVSFRNVKFSYTKNKKVIDGLSFELAAGENLGIVGKTGAGKSTIANLLIRLYDTVEGEILIDGVNVKDYALSDIRKNIAIVSQETYLFAGTIYENIRFANPEATKEEIINAAKLAGAHEFIVKLPDAYQTMVGFGYKDLSGGEKQRVSIARALLRDPRILILDEATAAMDTRTERKIQSALDSLSVGRTTITIAHRLSTLRGADRLIVIKDGTVAEEGTHGELVAKGGEYSKLYKLQLEALKNVGVEE